MIKTFGIPSPEICVYVLASVFACVVATPASAQTSVEAAKRDDFYLQWSDGRAAPIELATEYVAVFGDERRVRNIVPRDIELDVRQTNVGLPGNPISIARVGALPNEQRTAFLTAARTANVNVVGIPIRATAEPDAPVIGVATDEFVVRFHNRVSMDDIDTINNRMEVTVVSRGPPLFEEYGIRRYTLRASDPQAAIRIANEYFEMDETRYAHPNLVLQKVLRADPLFDQQWHLRNTGQNNGVTGADSKAAEAWQITRGEGVLIAMIDPHGVQANHEDLNPNRFINSGEDEPPGDGVDNDGNGLIDDWSGWNFDQQINNPATSRPHGTAAAGVAAASCGNNTGGCGAAPDAKILGIAQGRTVKDDADAFLYATSLGADVISNSWGYPLGSLQRPTDAVEEAIAFAATQGRAGKGAVILFAMTNENIDNFSGPNPDISSLDDVIAVGRSTNLDRWGKSGFGDGMEILAPTQSANGSRSLGCVPNDRAGTLEIVTTDLMGAPGYNDGSPEACFCNPTVNEIDASPNYTACFGGTSSATPLVAGVTALVLAVNPELTAVEVREILIETADKIEPDVANYQDDGQDRKYSTTHGYGRVNALAALRALRRARE